ncbi:replication protein A 32 kDa subunit [Diprion similis]|uniref:replication protein A 32 kDa subunit n=1 Tax=Diprion similis TaxID=362088 RepID=UPI001EF7554D|nr:replication protein A 32 kDa subunit [Diprion similis]
MWGEKAFANDGGGYFNSSEVSSPAANTKRGPKRAQNIVPVMMKHLIDSPDELQIWGTDVQIITTVGIVRRIDPSATKITYDIEDETGTITAFHWIEADKPPQESVIEVNTYVRVYGSLREQHQKKHILVMKIYPIVDLNELTLHLLETIYVDLKGEKLAGAGNMDATGIQDSKQPVGLQNSLMDSSIMGASLGGMTNDQKAVFKIIQSENDTPSGIERDQIKARVQPHIRSQVDDILDFLAGEGHIYTTLTDDHFKTT